MCDIKRASQGSSNNAPGPGGTPYSHIKQLSDVEMFSVVKDVNESILTSTSCLESLLKPLPKLGKNP